MPQQRMKIPRATTKTQAAKEIYVCIYMYIYFFNDKKKLAFKRQSQPLWKHREFPGSLEGLMGQCTCPEEQLLKGQRIQGKGCVVSD